MDFSKYHGAGNDFVLIDDRQNQFPNTDSALVAALCSPHTGIGADGLILIRLHTEADFEMLYYNADGKPGSLCGNGARCAASFANSIGACGNNTKFMAFDGLHTAEITAGYVSISMADIDLAGIRKRDKNSYFLDTGSPHLVLFTDKMPDAAKVQKEGSKLRHSAEFAEVNGTNVNFISSGVKKHNKASESVPDLLTDKALQIRTFERGVEAETLSCGTGVTAAAAVHYLRTEQSRVSIAAIGGVLHVSFRPEADRLSNVILSGPVKLVFSGTAELSAFQTA
ncbi:MAG: diaminopimelate epimerase [Bacteroidota bacterium]